MTFTRRRLAQFAAASGALGAGRRPLNLLILGGTGFIGPHQVRYALARGHRVTLFNRGRHPLEWPAEVEELTGDRNASDLKALEGRSWDVCIDNPTSLPFWVRDAGQALKGRVGHYIFISTLSVYAANDRPGEDESAPVQRYTGPDVFAEKEVPPALYGPLKAACEAEARKRFGEARTTVIRPGLIVGPGDETDRFTYWPRRLARGGEVLSPGDGSDPVQFIDARDLAEWTVRMAETRHTGTFNANGAMMTTRRMLAGVGDGIGAHPPLTWIPAAFLKAQNVQGWSDLPVWLPGEGETAGFHRRSVKAARDAGLTWRPLEITARDTLAYCNTLPEARRARPKTGLTLEREALLLERWRARNA